MNAIIHPIDGEIFGPNDKVRFYLFEHALRSNREIYEVPAGLSITEAVRLALDLNAGQTTSRKFAVYLQDGTRVPENMWDHVRLKPSTSVVARPLAEAPVFAIFGALASMVATASAFFTSLGFFGQLLLTGITIGAKFLLSKLFAPKPADQPDKSDAVPFYSISGSRNQVAQWQSIPLILGRHRITPPLAASPYTETVGDEQYLRQLFCNGYGPLYIEPGTEKIGETLVSTFEEAQIEHRPGYGVFEGRTTLYPSSVIDQPLSVELLQVDPPTSFTTATDTTVVGLDFMWPQGLTNYDDKGEDKDRKVNISIRYRIPPSGGWTSIPSINFQAQTQKVIRKTVTYQFPAAGQYEIEVHKETKEAGADFEKNNWIAVDTVQWTAIRSFRTGEPVRFTDAPISMTAIRIRASGRLNQTVDTYNCIVQSRVTAFNGTSWVANTPSRYPPDLFRWVLQCGANRRPYPDSKIDLPALQAWWWYCYQQGFVYDKVIIDQMSVFDLLTEICAAGRAMPIFKDGKWSVVWDDQTVPITQLFTPRNSWNFEEQRDLDPIPHGYRIRFANEDKGWREDERVVYNDGYSKANATLLEGFDTPGQTHTNRVWRHGRYHLAQRILRPGIYTLYTSWDALPLIRGDRVRVNYDTFKYGLYSGRVVNVYSTASVQTVEIDTNITLAGASDYMFRFRLANGQFLERSVLAGQTGEFTIVKLVGTGLPMPATNDLFTFGYSGGLDSRVLRVTGIEPMDNLVHRLTLVADAPEIAYADTGQIPDYNEGISNAIDPFTLPPRNLRVTDYVYADGGTRYWAAMRVTWEPPAYGRTVQFQVQYREEKDLAYITGGSYGPAETTAEIRQLEAGVYTIRVRCIFDNGKFSDWAVAPAKATTEFSTPPADVTDFRISTMGDLSVLRWNEVPGVGISYDIRYASDGVTAPTWNVATPLITALTNNAQIGTRTGTFFIKAKKPWGVTSTNASLIYTNVASLTNLNYVTEIVEEPLWAGTHDGTQIADEELRLIVDATGFAYNVSGTYNFKNSINLGELSTARLSLFLDAYGFNPQTSMATWLKLSTINPLDTIDKTVWSVQPEYRLTTVNPTLNQWGPWQPLSLTDVNAWSIQFRIVLTGKSQIDIETDKIQAMATPSIQRLWVQIDMADRIEQGEDIVAPATGSTIVFPNGKYRVIPAVVITPQNMIQGDYWIVDNKTTTGFRVRFFNVANAGKSLKFDWMSKGWGRT